jgi:putative SOS response-associated peptidase YedK
MLEGIMCGRVDQHTPPSELARLLEVALAAGVDPDGKPSWNVPPTRGLPVVTDARPITDLGEFGEDGPRVLDVYRWGLLPHWAKDPRISYKMINARSDKVATSGAYRTPLRYHRCLIVVDGFFEWRVPDPDKPKAKVPYYFRRADGDVLTFAGLYETWWDKRRSPDKPDPETLLRTCTIITTSAGPDMEEVHDRMPVIVERGEFDAWLDPQEHDPEVLTSLLVPSVGGTLVKFAVDTAVNSPRNDGPRLITPV